MHHGPEEELVLLRELPRGSRAHHRHTEEVGPHGQRHAVERERARGADGEAGEVRSLRGVPHEHRGAIQFDARAETVGRRDRAHRPRRRISEGGAHPQDAVLPQRQRYRVYRGSGPQEGVEDAREQGLHVVVDQRGGGDAVEGAQRPLARLRVAHHRSGDRLVDGLVQTRQLRGAERRRVPPRSQLGDAAPEDRILGHHLGKLVAHLEPLEGVDLGRVLGRFYLVAGANLVDVGSQVLDELGEMVEQDRPVQGLRGAHLADLRLPMREDLFLVLAQEVGEAARLVAGEQVGHAAKLRSAATPCFQRSPGRSLPGGKRTAIPLIMRFR